MRLGLILVLILVVGNLDYITGTEVSFSIIYLIPIAIAARFHERRTAVCTAVLAGLVWFFVELFGSPGFTHAWIPFWNACGRIVFFLLLVGYITEVYRRDAWLEAEVTRKTSQLREVVSSRRILEREMAQAVAREHAQVARELHDGVGQYLAGLALRARRLSDELKQAESSHAARAEELVEKLTITNRMLRRLDHILSPALSTEGGLNVAISRLVADVRQFSGLECSLKLPDEKVVIGEFQALTLFRIAQEAINNAVKHSQSKAVHIELATSAAGVQLKVSDEGLGYDTPIASGTGEGLRIMQHRAELIGARLVTKSSKGNGCTVECVLPWRGIVSASPKEGMSRE